MNFLANPIHLWIPILQLEKLRHGKVWNLSSARAGISACGADGWSPSSLGQCLAHRRGSVNISYGNEWSLWCILVLKRLSRYPLPAGAPSSAQSTRTSTATTLPLRGFPLPLPIGASLPLQLRAQNWELHCLANLCHFVAVGPLSLSVPWFLHFFAGNNSTNLVELWEGLTEFV